VEIELSRLMTQKAAWLIDTGRDAGNAANSAKYAAAEAAARTVDQAIQTHGGNGLSQEYGVAALLSVSRTGVGDPQAGQTENLDSITAVVLGGTSLFGGRGSIAGTLLGALIVGVFRNGLTLIGVSSVYQVLITGILVILAVAADKLSRRGAR